MALIDHQTVTNTIQNVTSGGTVAHVIHWVQTELSFFTIQEWIAVIVGVAAVAAYTSAIIHNIHKTRHLKNEHQKNQK